MYNYKYYFTYHFYINSLVHTLYFIDIKALYLCTSVLVMRGISTYLLYTYLYMLFIFSMLYICIKQEIYTRVTVKTKHKNL